MKNRVFLLLALCGCCSTWSCNDDEPATKAHWLTSEQIEKNTAVLDSAFSLAIKALGGSDKVKKLATAAESEEDFIREMNLLTKDAFNESIGVAWKIKSEPYRNSKCNAARLIEYNLNTEFTDPLKSYATAIEEDAVDLDGHEDEIEVYSLDLSHDNVLEALKVFELIMKHDDPHTLDDAIDDFFAEQPPPVHIALLLPAIQSAREAARRSSREQYIKHEMTDVLISSYQTGILIQQQNAAGYLGALDWLVSGEYKKDNENFVSLEAMRAIHLNTTAQVWHQVWKAYH